MNQSDSYIPTEMTVQSDSDLIITSVMEFMSSPIFFFGGWTVIIIVLFFVLIWVRKRK